MGFFQNLGRVFGIGKSKDQGDYGGIKPYKNLSDIEEGRLTTGELKERLAGRNVGFRPEFLDTYAPWAQSQRADLERYTKPGIRAAASSKGLGRSSIAQSQETLAGQQTEESIAMQRADLHRQNEIQRRGEINDALARMQQQAAMAAQVRGQAAGFDYNEFQRQQGFRERADAQQQAGLLRGVQTVAGMAAGGMGALPGVAGGAGGALAGGAYGLQGKMPSGILTAAGTPIDKEGAGGAGMVNVGGKQYKMSDIMAALQG